MVPEKNPTSFFLAKKNASVFPEKTVWQFSCPGKTFVFPRFSGFTYVKMPRILTFRKTVGFALCCANNIRKPKFALNPTLHNKNTQQAK